MVIEEWLEGRIPVTERAYRAALAAFGAWQDLKPESAADALLDLAAQQAGDLTARWGSEMERRGLAPRTVRARLIALRSLATFAGRLDIRDAIEFPAFPEGSRGVPEPTPDLLESLRQAQARMLDSADPAD